MTKLCGQTIMTKIIIKSLISLERGSKTYRHHWYNHHSIALSQVFTSALHDLSCADNCYLINLQYWADSTNIHK